MRLHLFPSRILHMVASRKMQADKTSNTACPTTRAAFRKHTANTHKPTLITSWSAKPWQHAFTSRVHHLSYSGSALLFMLCRFVFYFFTLFHWRFLYLYVFIYAAVRSALATATPQSCLVCSSVECASWLVTSSRSVRFNCVRAVLCRISCILSFSLCCFSLFFGFISQCLLIEFPVYRRVKSCFLLELEFPGLLPVWLSPAFPTLPPLSWWIPDAGRAGPDLGQRQCDTWKAGLKFNSILLFCVIGNKLLFCSTTRDSMISFNISIAAPGTASWKCQLESDHHSNGFWIHPEQTRWLPASCHLHFSHSATGLWDILSHRRLDTVSISITYHQGSVVKDYM